MGLIKDGGGILDRPTPASTTTCGGAADVAAYIMAYGAAHPSADITHDQAINLSDFSAYTAATSTAP